MGDLLTSFPIHETPGYLATGGIFGDLHWGHRLCECDGFWRPVGEAQVSVRDLPRDKKQKWKCEKQPKEKEKAKKKMQKNENRKVVTESS
jgi:hypothetical protein